LGPLANFLTYFFNKTMVIGLMDFIYFGSPCIFHEHSYMSIRLNFTSVRSLINGKKICESYSHTKSQKHNTVTLPITLHLFAIFWDMGHSVFLDVFLHFFIYL